MIKHKFSFYLFSILFFSCANFTSGESQKKQPINVEQEIEEALSEKYLEQFKIKDLYFDKGLNQYVFSASPLNKNAIVFEGNYNELKPTKNKRLVFDSYPNIKWSYEASVYYQSLFPNKELLHVAKASVVENYSHIKGTKVLDWSVYYKKRTDECTILMNTYYFTIPESPYDQTIVTHRAIMEELHNIYENNFSMYAGFWADNFLENNELTEQSFGFSATNQEDADNLLMKVQYLEKVLFIKIISGSVSEINEEKLFGLIKDYNKNGQDVMTEL